jgi:23S rRNA (cytidine1920-2'-O)/16S rRNA (cytidine1409-2'-O)-methyltransferase
MKPKTSRKRLDLLLVERGLAASRQKAQAMILAGEVSVNGARAEKAGLAVAQDANVEVSSRAQKYVSRGGLKLEGALADFSVSATGRICLDIGSSTGGFTDCLLRHGAARVYAVDVTIHQLAWKLQQDARVILIERNARELQPSEIPASVDLVVIDVSFISVTKVLPAILGAAAANAEFLILVKPQFELQRADIGPGGIVREPALREKAVSAVRQCAESLGLVSADVKPSRVTGAEGNQEFFLHARKSP